MTFSAPGEGGYPDPVWLSRVAIQTYFSAPGEGGLVDKFRKATSSDLTFDGTFAQPVAEHRDKTKCLLSKAYMDFVYHVWAGTDGEDFDRRTLQE